MSILYEQVLHEVFRICDVEDYGIGVTTGEDDDTRWIKITFLKDR